jgi:histone H3/H4
MDDFKRMLEVQGFSINKDSIRRIIRDAGYRFRSARRVLTSTDPLYKEKLEEITRTLSNLTESQKFFSIDEFGPFAVKIQGGRALTAPIEQRTVPQQQKSKGSLTLIGALELATNQITHFYANRKSTVEMIKLTHYLLCQYRDQTLIYLSWDAASWHASSTFLKEVARVNDDEYRNCHHTPCVALVPLPASAQFLNVIESVFSGMARAIIHNSDYTSVEECKGAIDRYLNERNEFFIANPKRAGNKIWGKERCPSVFSPSNNCKDPNFR